jgi:peroxiredoxin
VVPTNELEGFRGAKSLRRYFAIGVSALLGVTVLVLATRPAPAQQAPHFQLPLLSGDGALSSTDLRGSPVVLNFWQSACPPCRREAPLLESAWRRYRRRGVTIVGVNIEDTPSTARRFVRRFGITYPVVVDRDQRLAGALRVYGLPETFFIDRDWHLRATHGGRKLASGESMAVLGAISPRELFSGIDSIAGEQSRG